MKKTFFSTVLLCFILIVHVNAYVDEFEAKLLPEHSPDARMAKKLKIEVKNYTSYAEVLQLIKTYHEQGYKKYRKAFHKMKKGFIRPMGGRGTNITIHAAQNIPTDSGREVILVGNSQSWNQDSVVRIDRRFPYFVIKLHLDNSGKGNGEIYVQANIKLDVQGTIKMSGYNMAPKQLPWVTTME